MKLDQAQIDNAKAILDYTSILAPIAGRTGIRQVDQGNIVRDLGYQRHRRHHPAPADLGVVHAASAAARRRQSRDRRWHAAGGRVRPRQQDGGRDRRAQGGRQPGRSVDRHDQAQGRISQPRTAALARRLHQRPALDQHAQAGGGGADGGRAARPDRHLRLCRSAGQQGRGAAGDGVAAGRSAGGRRHGPGARPARGDHGLCPPHRRRGGGGDQRRGGAVARRAAPAATAARRRAEAGETSAPRPRQARARAPGNERLHALHPASDRNLASGFRGDAGRLAGLLVAAGLVAAAGRFPDHPGHHAVAGRQPRHHRRAGDRAAGASVRPDPVAVGDDVVELVRHQPGHVAVRSRPRHRRRRAGRAGRHQRCRLDLAARAALSADLRQGEPGRCAGADAGDDLADHLASQPQRSCRHPDGAAAGRGWRRRPRLDPGRHPAGGAHPGRSGAARRLRHRPRRPSPGDRRRQRLRREGLARRSAPVLHHFGQRSVDRRRILQGAGRRLSQRRAGAVDRRRRRSSMAWRTKRSAPGIRARRPWSSISSASRAPT